VSKGSRINVNLPVVSRWRSARASVKACGPYSKNSCFRNPNLGESCSLILLNFAVPSHRFSEPVRFCFVLPSLKVHCFGGLFKSGTACGKTKLGFKSGFWAPMRYRLHQLVSTVSCVRLVRRSFPGAAPVAVLPGKLPALQGDLKACGCSVHPTAPDRAACPPNRC